jgi:putative ABC transport system permease protein
MKLETVLFTALWSLGRNKGRTALTMLGIVIGVAAVVSVVSLGEGLIQNSNDSISSMGVNLISVRPGSKILGGFRPGMGNISSLVPQDAEALLAECPSVARVSPGVRTAVHAVFQERNRATTLEGGSADYLTIRGWSVARGTFFNDDQARGSAKVCVLGSTVAENLFAGYQPLGQTIRVGKVPLEVIGVLTTKGQTSMGQDQDDVIVVPWSTGMRRVMGINHLNSIIAMARDTDSVARAVTEISTVLRRRHRLTATDEDDFSCQTQKDAADAQQQNLVVMMTLVVIIAVIALLVGGIGVMNIMLVSVLERTREIGIRMAVGARGRAVLLQFLGETIVLTSLGGLIGIALGVGVAFAVPWIWGWPMKLNPSSMVVSFLFSAAVGVFFGMYPAIRASRMNPIDALRYE